MIDYNSNKIDIELKFINLERPKRLKFIKNELNKFLKEDYNENFYEIVIGDWLDNLSNVSHLVWIDNINHDSKYKNNIINVPFNSYDFNTLRGDKKFNSQLYFLKKKTVNLNFENLKFDIFYSNIDKKNSIKEKIFNKLKELKNIFSTKEILLYSSNFIGRPRNYLFKTFINNKIYFPKKMKLSNKKQINLSWRINRIEKLDKISSSYDFFKFLFFFYIPISLLENLKENIDLVKKSLIKKNPKKNISSKDLHFNIGFKIQTYFYKLYGAELIYIQHGGNYGLDNIHQFENYEIKCSDKFISWGWKYNYKNVFPLAQPIIDFEISKKKKKQNLLVMGNYASFPYRLHFQPMGKIRVNKMRDETVSFLKKLGNYEDFYIRPYQDYDGDVDLNLKKNFSNFKFENSNNIFKIFKNCRIVVHNYLCTSYLLTLTLNIPTVCFFDDEVYKFRPEADYFVKKFIDFGIFHQNGASAANFLKKVNIDEWWSQKKVQKIRKLFVNKYSKFSNNYSDPWCV